MNDLVSPLRQGEEVPDFETTDETGVVISKSNLLGEKYLIYFYPRDNTPGCSMEASGFRDLVNSFRKQKIKIFGVSGCSMSAHLNFQKKIGIPFPLLMDEDHSLAKSFGVFGEKRFMGRTFNGIHRMSFLISEIGKVSRAYHKVKPKTHPQEVLDDLE